jgi:hypothetical protein
MSRRGRRRRYPPAGSPASSTAPPAPQASGDYADDSAWAERLARFVITDPGEWAPRQRDRELAGFERDADRGGRSVGDRATSIVDRAIFDLSKVQAAPISWLWPGRIPRGRITVLDGDPGLGKSALLLDLAARLTTGRPMPDDPAPPEPVEGPEPVQGPLVPSPSTTRLPPSTVLVLSAEDGLADTIRPRLEAAGADLSRVVTIPFLPTGYGQYMIQLPGDTAALTRLAIHSGAVLLVVDPFIAFLNTKININDDHRLRSRLAPLVLLAERANLAVVLVRHLTKRAARTPLHLGRGAVGLGGLARAALLVGPDPSDPSGARRVLATSKSNLAAPPPSLAYRLVTAPNGAAAIQWEGPTSHTAASLLAGAAPNRDEDALEDATIILREILADGPVPATTVRREAGQAGLGPHALRRAKAALGVRSRKLGGRGTTDQGWVWARCPRILRPRKVKMWPRAERAPSTSSTPSSPSSEPCLPPTAGRGALQQPERGSG